MQTLCDWSADQLLQLQSDSASAEVVSYAREFDDVAVGDVARQQPWAGEQGARWALRMVTSRSFCVPVPHTGDSGAGSLYQVSGSRIFSERDSWMWSEYSLPYGVTEA